MGYVPYQYLGKCVKSLEYVDWDWLASSERYQPLCFGQLIHLQMSIVVKLQDSSLAIEESGRVVPHHLSASRWRMLECGS